MLNPVRHDIVEPETGETRQDGIEQKPKMGRPCDRVKGAELQQAVEDLRALNEYLSETNSQQQETWPSFMPRGLSQSLFVKIRRSHLYEENDRYMPNMPISSRAAKALRIAAKKIESIKIRRNIVPGGPVGGGTLMTKTVRCMEKALREAFELQERGIVALTGPSGTGKTTALDYALSKEEYERFPKRRRGENGALYLPADKEKIQYIHITANCSWRQRYPLVRIAEELDLDRIGTASALLDRIARFQNERAAASWQKVMIVIDEAEWLFDKTSSLNMLRSLHDACKCPFLMVGVDHRITASVRDLGPRSQIGARFANVWAVTSVTEKEARVFYRAIGFDYPVEIQDYITKKMQGNLHNIRAMAEGIIRFMARPANKGKKLTLADMEREVMKNFKVIEV